MDQLDNNTEGHISKKVSINPFSKEEYPVPLEIDDSENINNFLLGNKGKRIVVVQGLGFVGAVMSLVCANSVYEDYAVIGVDIADERNLWKIRSINEGQFPLIADDPKIEEFFKNSKDKNNFYATFDPYAYSLADVIIVDINLDVEKNSEPNMELSSFNVNLDNFEDAIKTIGDHCKERALILVETTVPPGTCKEKVFPIIKDRLHSRGLDSKKIKIGHSYERVMPGPDYIDSIQNFYRVYSGINSISAEATEKFLRSIINTDNYPLTRLSNTNASEIAKVLENSYRAMNISFMVEWSRFAEESEVNLYEVVNAIRLRPTHSNIMFPGIGVGGYCLTKDPLMASWSRQKLFNGSGSLKQSEQSVSINDQMPRFAFEFFSSHYQEDLAGKNVLFLGVSYRGDVGDTRYSPVALIYDLFVESSANVFLHDPYVTFWEEKNASVTQSINEIAINEIDIIVISAGHSIYQTKEFKSKIFLNDGLFIFDTIGLLQEEEISSLSKKNTIKILGRGDI